MRAPRQRAAPPKAPPGICIEPLYSQMLGPVCFFQAEDGIRDWSVTGVQTCALPISGCPGVHRQRVTGRPPRRARTPRRHLYRIGRPPDPLAWPPHAVIGQERFDDPLRQYRVLYAAAQRAGCFAETLAAFRPSLASLAAERAVLNTIEPLRTATIPAEWWRNRLVATFRLAPGRWLDLRTLTTFQVLREEFAELASSLGLADVDLSAATGRVAI